MGSKAGDEGDWKDAEEGIEASLGLSGILGGGEAGNWRGDVGFLFVVIEEVIEGEVEGEEREVEEAGEVVEEEGGIFGGSVPVDAENGDLEGSGGGSLGGFDEGGIAGGD